MFNFLKKKKKTQTNTTYGSTYRLESLLTGTSIIQTPLYYGQFIWSLREQNPYKACTCSSLKHTSTIIRTLTPVPLVSVIKRFDCIADTYKQLIYVMIILPVKRKPLTIAIINVLHLNTQTILQSRYNIGIGR